MPTRRRRTPRSSPPAPTRESPTRMRRAGPGKRRTRNRRQWWSTSSVRRCPTSEPRRRTAREWLARSGGDSIGARATQLRKLPQAARAAQEAALLKEAYGIEMQMVEIEHEALAIKSDYLPASYKGTWKSGTPGEGIWVPEPTHPAYA